MIYSLFLLLIVKMTIARVSPEQTPLAWWKCGVYAAFPGGIIGSVIVAFSLPYISFSTVYILSTMVYGLHAIMKVEYIKQRNAGGIYDE